MLSYWVPTHTCVLETTLIPPQLVNCAMSYVLNKLTAVWYPPSPLTPPAVFPVLFETCDHIGWEGSEGVIILTLEWWHLLIACHLCNWREAIEVRTRDVWSASKCVKLAQNEKKTGLLSHWISMHFGLVSQNVLKSDLEKSRIFPHFGTIWPTWRPNWRSWSDIHQMGQVLYFFQVKFQ